MPCVYYSFLFLIGYSELYTFKLNIKKVFIILSNICAPALGSVVFLYSLCRPKSMFIFVIPLFIVFVSPANTKQKLV